MSSVLGRCQTGSECASSGMSTQSIKQLLQTDITRTTCLIWKHMRSTLFSKAAFNCLFNITMWQMDQLFRCSLLLWRHQTSHQILHSGPNQKPKVLLGLGPLASGQGRGGAGCQRECPECTAVNPAVSVPRKGHCCRCFMMGIGKADSIRLSISPMCKQEL